MTTIATALNELGITEWVLRGEPTTEDEFNEMFRKVTFRNLEDCLLDSEGFPLGCLRTSFSF